MLGSVLSVIASGFVIGALARLALPGPDPLPFALTVLLGLGGSLVGGGVAAGLFGARNTFDTSNHAFVTLLLEIVAATAILALYRHFVQKRPLTGPGARAFPARGFGIERMRSRLRSLGVDPDKLTGGEAAQPTPDEHADALAELRKRRDRGELTEEEYEAERERLRRY